MHYYFSENRQNTWYSATKFRIFRLTVFGKLLPPIGSKKFRRILKICPALHQKFFGNGEFCFTEAKISRKLKILQGEGLLPSRFFSAEFLNFVLESRHPLKFKPCMRSPIKVKHHLLSPRSHYT